MIIPYEATGLSFESEPKLNEQFSPRLTLNRINKKVIQFQKSQKQRGIRLKGYNPEFRNKQTVNQLN